jgi:predicted translin family RNA/ssDNA-binding protein
LIFLLHRIAGPSPADPTKLFEEARTKEQDILALFQKVSVELRGHDAWRHHRTISPGIEEYVRASVLV